ncbi:MAG: hypothetical protein LQ352_008406 [Teloschistes flavicans]|nr:MAG: hypothetical protein LQ352_008406 [Teloschistes flavicans]
MAPTVHLVRHAQAVHNLTVANHGMHDPALTPHGENQCLNLRSSFPYHSSVKLLVCSPLRRTIQTTLLAFEPEASRGVPCIALPEIQETSDLPCDTGSKLSEIMKDFKDQPVDFSLVPDDWNSKQGKWEPAQHAIDARCQAARKWLRSRDEDVVVVVAHGGLLHYLTQDWTDSGKFQGKDDLQLDRSLTKIPLDVRGSPAIGTGWENTEFRSYRFIDREDENASMEETAESYERRKHTEKPLTKEEKTQLRETSTKTWQEQGYEKASKV